MVNNYFSMKANQQHISIPSSHPTPQKMKVEVLGLKDDVPSTSSFIWTVLLLQIHGKL